MPKVDLKLDWATHKAAKYACENWHYSKCMPVGKLVKVGVWENKKFIGVVLFSRGANNNMLKPFGLGQNEGCELTRIALKKHQTPVSRIMRIAFALLKSLNAGLRIIVSYADEEQGHYGGIYQAANWVYSGAVKMDACLVDGKKMHRKSIHSKYGFDSIDRLNSIGVKAERIKGKPKHRYLMPLDKAMKEQIEELRQPYPKREKQAMASNPEAQRRCSTDLHAPNSVEKGAGISPRIVDAT